MIHAVRKYPQLPPSPFYFPKIFSHVGVNDYGFNRIKSFHQVCQIRCANANQAYLKIFHICVFSLSSRRWNVSVQVSDVEHVFMWLLAICMFSLGRKKCLLRSFAQFLINFYFKFHEFFIYIPDINLLLSIWFANVFSQAVGSLFILLLIFFTVKKHILVSYSLICLFLLLMPLPEEIDPKQFPRD